MYETSLDMIIEEVSKEIAYREYEYEIKGIYLDEDLSEDDKEIELQSIKDMVEQRFVEVKEELVEDFSWNFALPGYDISGNKGKLRNLRVKDEIKDHVVIEYDMEGNHQFNKIKLCETIKEVEETILSWGYLEDEENLSKWKNIEVKQNLIVLEKGKVKEFRIEPCKCCYTLMVKWLE